MRRVSELAPYTSGHFRWCHVWSEVKEMAQSRSWAEVKDEIRDVVTTSALWAYFRLGMDMPLPEFLSSEEKYVGRADLCREVLMEEGLYSEARESREGPYFMRYTRGGSNLMRPHKRRAFIQEARKDT